MQVILVNPVRKLGKVGEVVNVKNGYGRNYLIPQKLAIRATKDNVATFEATKKDLEAQNIKYENDAKATAKTITGKNFTFITESAADGRLYGSVNTKSIANKISASIDYGINYSNILLDEPIKFNGVYEVQIALHPEVISSVLIVVAKSDSEAQGLLQEFKEETNKEKNTSTEEAQKI